MKTTSKFVGATAVDDYIFRPFEYEDCNVYEWIQVHTRCKRTPSQLADFAANVSEHVAAPSQNQEDDAEWLDVDLPPEAGRELADELGLYAYREGHPLWRTHYARCDRRYLDITVPNFIGGSLPRKDQGDREIYCRTMLTLFKPWRDGLDLKMDGESWDTAFNCQHLSDKYIRIMKNSNLRYECNDAQDNY
ncbi:hypothetical protein C8R45DRAFT_840407, partial [Mycena sanguinolenta]